jgi:hypothetical protein
MINITIEGIKDSAISDTILDASYIFLEKLLPKCKKLEVNIFVEPTGSYDAFLEKIDDYTFEVYIKPKKKVKHQLIYLAHEFVHIKQYVLKELQDHDHGIIWKGILYESDKVYDSIPWESEAYEFEEELYNTWLSLRS